MGGWTGLARGDKAGGKGYIPFRGLPGAGRRGRGPAFAEVSAMLSHERIWAAIDRLAARNALTTSGLARKAGLDPTTFNRSKRIAGDGRLRWPSTESISKILDATGEPLDGFM